MATTEVTLFDGPVTLPAYLQTSDIAKQLAAQTEGGLAGGMSVNRISLRGGKFRFNKEGVEVGVHRGEFLDVVIVGANPHVSRTFYLKQYSDGDSATRPDCYSKDGRTPEADSPAVQAEACAVCPQNIKGSAVGGTGKGKACGYRKRLVVTSDTWIDGDAFALDVAAMGLFGDDNPAMKQFNLKSYIEALKANGLIANAVVTRLTFDDKSTVPKLFFKPIRPLTAEEWALVEARINDPEVRKMLVDIDNKAEEGKPVGAVAALPSHAQAPASTPDATPARRGRPAKVDTPPAQAPAPAAAPAAAATPSRGFGVTETPTPGVAYGVQGAKAPAVNAATATKGFSVDLDEFDA